MKLYPNAIFFPAISIATHTQIMKANFKVKGKSPRFYLRNVPESTKLFDHPYILTSAAHNYKNMDFMKDIGLNDVHTDTEIVFGDSGGFQIATGSLKETPELINKLYEWMERNSTVSPVIDCPPWKAGETDISYDDIDIALAKTIKNVETLKLRPKTKNIWLNVVQGRTHEHKEYWYKKIKHLNLNGWALGSLRPNAFSILSSFITLYDNGALDDVATCQLIHFFGMSSTKAMPIMVYLKYKLNEKKIPVNISFDSSYATQNGGYGKYLAFPSCTGFKSYHLTNKAVGKFNNVPLPCSCPVCDGLMLADVLNEKALKTEGESYYYNVVQSHNVYMLKEYVNMLHSLIYTGNNDLMSTVFSSDQMKSFKVIDQIIAHKGSGKVILGNNSDILNKADLADEDEDGKAQRETLEEMFG